jgi:glyoxylase-like metal-dependent hydrolase (beta-lactamase superfamily II)
MSIRAVHHLNCASMCPVAGFLLGNGGWRGRMVAHCLLVETERDGLVLVDTGFGTRDVEGATGLSRSFRFACGPALSPDETAIAQVQALGFSATDVRHIVVTHLDVDHAGGLVDFPHAKVHLHAREHAAAMARAHRKERERYITSHWAHGPKWEVYAEDGDTWRGLPAIARLRGLDADIGLLPLHGHTRGHSAVIVHDRERWLVHAGDAYFHRNSIEGDAPPPAGYRAFERFMEMSGTQRRASVAALRQLCASYRDLDVFCAHDEREYNARSGAARDAVSARSASRT